MTEQDERGVGAMPQPLQVDENRLFITGGYKMISLWLEVRKGEGGWTTRARPDKTYAGFMHSPVLYQDHIYMQSFSQHGAAASGLICMDREGKLKWQSGPGVQFNSGGMVIADGMIFIMNGKNGELSLVEARPEGFRVMGKAKVLGAEDGAAWGVVALAEGRLVVRDGREMKCLDVKGR